MADLNGFYDRIAPYYHLVYQDWNASVKRQAKQLSNIIKQHWGLESTVSILDVSCGIGTQALGLAQIGFQITASDLSELAVTRAQAETAQRGLSIDFSLCDMREAYVHHKRQFDLVISCDNSITHLLTDDDILRAFEQIYLCVKPGGGCLITVRDYDTEERGVGLVKPYGIREEDGQRVIIFQVWDFVGDVYDLSMYFIMGDGRSAQPVTQVMHSKFYAIGISKLLNLMEEAGFTSVERLDEVFFQPVLIATRPA